MDKEMSSLTNSASAIQMAAEKPVCLLVIGMAGAGKSSFVQRLTSYLHSRRSAPYVINMDPACHEVAYPCNIDIRDTVNYKEVMKQYSLGPNGAIMTSLNLFTTKFNQIMELIEKRSNECKYCIIDTPGQIEVFTWSASGSIITEALASTFPTIVVYVMDTPRSTNPITFMSNMLYACSIMYKSKLPFVIVMNKNDIIHHGFVGEWITNFDSFQNALENETSYMSNLTRSLSLVLDEFYQSIKFVGVSSTTGNGFDDFVDVVQQAVVDYENNYKPEYERFKQKKTAQDKERQEEQLKRFEQDLASDKLLDELNAKGGRRRDGAGEKSATQGPEIVSTFQDDEDDDAEKPNNDEESEKDKLELESFKRFLDKSNDLKI